MASFEGGGLEQGKRVNSNAHELTYRVKGDGRAAPSVTRKHCRGSDGPGEQKKPSTLADGVFTR